QNSKYPTTASESAGSQFSCTSGTSLLLHRQRFYCVSSAALPPSPARKQGLKAVPEFPIQRPVLHRFRNVFAENLFCACQVCNRAGNFQAAVVGAGRKYQLDDCLFQQLSRCLAQLAVLPDLDRSHLSVTKDRSRLLEAPKLNLPSRQHPFGNGSGRFRAGVSCQFIVLHLRYFDVDIDPVQQRPGDLIQITVDQGRSADTFLQEQSKVPAGAGGHSRDQHEIRGKGESACSSTDSNCVLFKRPPQSFQDMTLELGQFVEKEHPFVSQRYFSWPRCGTASHHTRSAYRMMGRSKRTVGDELTIRPQQAGHTVNGGGLQRLGEL